MGKICMTSFNQYEYIQKCIRLPIEFDAQRALREVRTIPNGLYDNSSRGPTHTQVRGLFIKGYPPRLAKPDDDRKILKSLPYISSFIQDGVPGKACKCVIAKLQPSGIIPVHSDRILDSSGHPVRGSIKARYFEDTIRLHIPVTTSRFTHFFNNGEFFVMREGEVWAINNLAIHGVINEHPTDTRIHLIVDILPDEKTEAVVKNADFITGNFDQNLLAKLMKNSMAPANSIYARGRGVPDHSIIENIAVTPQ
jgi:hypothetical protein